MGVISRIWKSLGRSDDRYFRTRKLHLATALFAQNFALVNVDRTEPASCEFVFRNSFDLHQMVEWFDSKEPIFVEATVSSFAESCCAARSRAKHL
jgi:hypothetical protein